MKQIYYIIQTNDNMILDILLCLNDALNKFNYYIKLNNKFMTSTLLHNSSSKLISLDCYYHISIFSNYSLGTIKKKENIFILETDEINNEIIINIKNNLNNFNNINEIDSIFIKDTVPNEIKLNLPLDVLNHSMDTNETTNTMLKNCAKSTKNDINIDISYLSNKIKELDELKRKEELDLENIKKNIDKDKKMLNENKLINFEIKKKLNLEKDKWNSIMNKYIANKKVYYLLKDEDKNSETIPELFTLEWPVFKNLDIKGLIKRENDNLDNEIRCYYFIQPKGNIDIDHTFKNIFDSQQLECYNDCSSESD